MKRGIIVVYYNYGAEQWNFSFISEEKVIFSGTVERGQSNKAEGVVEVDYYGIGNFGTEYHHVGKFPFNEFWADCEGFNRKMMTELVNEAHPEIEVTSIMNI